MDHSYTDSVSAQIAAQHQRYAFPAPAATASAQATPRVIHRHFTVSDEATALQALAWRDYVSRSVDVPLSRTQVANGFRARIDTYVLDKLAYLDTRTDPLVQIRSAAKISGDNNRDFVFHVAVDGIIETLTGPHSERKSLQFAPGILALDMGQPLRMERPAYSRVLAFFIPRAMVEERVPDAAAIHGNVIAYTSPLTRLLRDHVVTLSKALPHMNDVDAERAVRAGAELAIAAFAKQTRLSGGARAAARAALLDQIKRHIDANLHSDTLTPESVLGEFNVPRPTLYRMFEPDGGLNAYIRNCRLREAASELVRFPQTSIMEIAFGLGFNSHSDFTRSFRRIYGMSPGDYRYESLSVI